MAQRRSKNRLSRRSSNISGVLNENTEIIDNGNFIFISVNFKESSATDWIQFTTHVSSNDSFFVLYTKWYDFYY